MTVLRARADAAGLLIVLVDSLERRRRARQGAFAAVRFAATPFFPVGIAYIVSMP